MNRGAQARDKNPLILTEAKTLSRAADEVTSLARSRALTKNTVLNAIARAILGDGRNWGALKAGDQPVLDPRAAERRDEIAPAGPADRQAPARFRDLQADDLSPVALPDGKTGWLPLARLSGRGDGGIDLDCPLWGPAFLPNAEDRLISCRLTLDAEQVLEIADGWPSADSLKRDLAWGRRLTGSFATLTEGYGHLCLYFANGIAVIDEEALHALALELTGRPSRPAT